jgi:hypothetical protein
VRVVPRVPGLDSSVSVSSTEYRPFFVPSGIFQRDSALLRLSQATGISYFSSEPWCWITSFFGRLSTGTKAKPFALWRR